MNETRKFRILSLDGGGIRGAFTAGYLSEIERVISRPLGEYFDLIAGTSTGGIIAAGIAFRVPAKRIETFYREHGPQIFRRRWRSPSTWPRFTKWVNWTLRSCHRIPIAILDIPLKAVLGIDTAWILRTKYSEQTLVTALREVFAHEKLIKAENRLVLPSVNVKKGQTKVFKTPHLEYLYVDKNYEIVDVLRATSAAPTYFSHATIDSGSAYVDGGLWANNPIVVAIIEAMALSSEANKPDSLIQPFDLSDVFALSIGTGNSRFFAAPPRNWAGLAWWHPEKLFGLIAQSQSQGSQFQASYLLGSRLSRIDFELPQGNWSLDNTKLVNEMIHIGHEKAAEDMSKLRDSFFKDIAPKYLARGE